ncbi:MAG: hypothetical protein WA755_05505 [Candidatus Acidiferrales bacterium]
MSSLTGGSLQVQQSGIFGRFTTWLDAMPHPAAVCEIAADHVAVARWSARGANLEAGGVEALESGAINPSPVETNIPNCGAVQSALRRLIDRFALHGQDLALLLPDPVVRVFILPFEMLPRRADEAVPLLRFRLKKSVPFDVEDTVISWMRQPARNGGLEIITAVARKPMVREYEAAIEAVGGKPGVVLSSTLACMPLLDESGATMLVRVGGKSLTTVIVRGGILCVYRATEMAADVAQLEFQAIVDEIFPAVAYYQDTWGGELDRILLAGFGEREETIRATLENEMHTTALPLAESETARRFPGETRALLSQGLESLVGWMANGI